jgi:hypothetical protein
MSIIGASTAPMSLLADPHGLIHLVAPGQAS